MTDREEAYRNIAGENVRLKKELELLRERIDEGEFMAQRMSSEIQYLKEQLVQEQRRNEFLSAQRQPFPSFTSWSSGISVGLKAPTQAEVDAILGKVVEIKQPERLILL